MKLPTLPWRRERRKRVVELQFGDEVVIGVRAGGPLHRLILTEVVSSIDGGTTATFTSYERFLETHYVKGTGR